MDTPIPMHLAPKPSLRGWSHITAFIGAMTLCPILISYSAQGRALATLYSLAVIALFGVSSLYHGFSWSARAHDLLRRIDHATIFVTIAATYTLISWYVLPRFAAVTVLLAVWVGAFLGVLVMIFLANCSSTDPYYPFHNCWVVSVDGDSRILDGIKLIRFHVVTPWRSVPHNWRNCLWNKEA